MLDLKHIRRDPEAVRAALARRGAADVLDELLELDERRRELLPQLEELRATQNAANDKIGEAKRSGEDAPPRSRRCAASAAEVKQLQAEVGDVEEQLQPALAGVPNLPDPTAPDEDDVLREVGEAGKPGRDHLELLGGLVDMEAGARVAGSRFAYLKGPLVLLEFALVRWALEVLGGKGFEPVVPPVLVREEALYGTGFLPDTEQQIYALPEDDLYLAGTSEVPLASLHAGQILDDAAAAALRRLLDLLPPRGGRRRQGHARDLPRAPVRQGRDVHVRAARGLAGRARAPARDRGGDPPGARDPLPRGEHRRGRPRRARRRRSTTSRRGCPGRSATAS